MVLLSKLEQRYSKYTDLIEPMHSIVMENSVIDIMEYWKFIGEMRKYPTCIVGDIRDKLGLSRDYHIEGSCQTCEQIATNFYDLTDHSGNQKGYEFILQQFPKHLQKDHGVSL